MEPSIVYDPDAEAECDPARGQELIPVPANETATESLSLEVDESLSHALCDKISGLKYFCRREMISGSVEDKLRAALEPIVEHILHDRTLQLAATLLQILDTLETKEKYLSNKERELNDRVQRILDYEQRLKNMEAELNQKAHEMKTEVAKIQSVKDSLSLLLGKPITTEIQVPKGDWSM